MNSVPLERYDRTMIGLHWLIAILIIWGFCLGWIMTDIPGFTPAKLRYFSWHKWIGVTIFTLTLFRIAWRISHRPPQTAVRELGWQRTAAGLVHLSLYGLMLVIPISGYLYSSAAGIQVVYLGLVPLPTIIEPNQALKATLRTVHLILNYSLLSLVCLHFLAALKHQFIDRDGILKRMVPFIK
ncbi:cytochrome b [Paraburkholderia panacisoli]|uniref:Cytochrome b n=1 Tax=Paraburkholderia panacisoli TaxID=2603818 RepID=A0A5B0G6Y7_9BURK|nr:cytochrome b [Paraburkholderia panacisoli]KAA0999147.1 cytochrome b [Paraburkholderia panacisoli]